METGSYQHETMLSAYAIYLKWKPNTAQGLQKISAGKEVNKLLCTGSVLLGTLLLTPHLHIDPAIQRYNAYFLGEVMGDMSAATDYARGDNTPRRVLNFNGTPSSRRSPSPTYLVDSPYSSKYNTSPIGEAGRIVMNAHQRTLREFNHSSIKILDAPDLKDDFYLNLIDWGSNDILAVGLGTSVYLWNAETSKVNRLCEYPDDSVTSVCWASGANRLAVGTNRGYVYLYDTEIMRRIRRWEGHTGRTGSLAWNFNVLTSGGRDHKIFHHDVRVATENFCELTDHTQEVCGLKWNPEGTMLASGGNDNNLIVWESTSPRLLHRFEEHTAAIKAIAWSPYTRGLLASGGGTADKTIRFWNAMSGVAISSYTTGAQVCNLAWSTREDELVSSHGFSSSADSTSNNQVLVWKADPENFERLATLSGHTSRVLYMSMSYDSSTVVTGAGDETLRFWELYPQSELSARSTDVKLLR